MRYIIRPMSEADIDNVFAIEEEVHIAPWTRSILRDCVRVGYDCRVFELHEDGNMVLGGYIICRHCENNSHILNLCIAKHVQSKGYGRILLESVLTSLTTEECIDYIFLEVRPSNKAALHLYFSMGFIQVEIKPEYYNDEKGVEDAIVLKKELRT